MPEATYGFVSLMDGMHGGINPQLLKETAYAKGINVSSRRGLIHTRPGFVAETTCAVPAGVFQGAGVWSLNSGDRLVFVVSGRVYAWHTESHALTDLGVLRDASAQCFLGQVGEYFMIQDGSGAPVVLEEVGGVPAVYSGAVTFPSGYLFHYVHGRIHGVPKVVPGTTEDGRPYFVSGDVLLPDEPENVLQATETEYWNEGGAHSLPMEMGFIRGLVSFRNASTGTGAGAMLVFGRRGVSAFDMSIERKFWKETALSQVLFFGPGTDSPRSPVAVNSDVAYRADDGIRFIRFSATAVANSLSNTPQSSEVEEWLALDARTSLPFVSMAFADNRLLCTAAGVDTRYFKGLVSLDTALVSAFSGAGSPAYDGLWTGFDFAQVLAADCGGRKAHYVFTRGPQLYRLDAGAATDPGNTPILSRVITRAFIDTVDLKQIKYAEIWASELKVATTFRVWYRPTGYPLWALLGERTLSVPTGSLPQVRRKVRIALDVDSKMCNPATGEALWKAQDFQFALDFEGHAQIDKFRVVVESLTEGPPEPCEGQIEAVMVGELAGQVLDDFEYEVT